MAKSAGGPTTEGILAVLIVAAIVSYNHSLMGTDVFPKSIDLQFLKLWEAYPGLDSGLPHTSYPPLAYLVASAFFRTCGTTLEAAQQSMTIFTVIFLVAVYGTGRELGGRLGGLAVLVLAASSPVLLDHERPFNLDFPNAALNALAFYMLLKSRNYSSTRYSVLYGISLGLALLSKWSTVCFLAAPTLWFLLPAGVASRRAAALLTAVLAAVVSTVSVAIFLIMVGDDAPISRRPQQLVLMLVPALMLVWGLAGLRRQDRRCHECGLSNVYNFLLVFAISFCLAAPWYLWNYAVLSRGLSLQMQYSAVERAHASGDGVLYFVETMFVLAPVLLCAGLASILACKEDRFRTAVLPIGLLGSVLVLRAIAMPESRFMLSLIILGAPLGAFWIGRLAYEKAVKLLFILSILAVSSLVFRDMPVADRFPFYRVRTFGRLDISDACARACTRIPVADSPTRWHFDLRELEERVLSAREGAVGIAFYETQLLSGDEYIEVIHSTASSLGCRVDFGYTQRAIRAGSLQPTVMNGIEEMILVHKVDPRSYAAALDADMQTARQWANAKGETVSIGEGVVATVFVRRPGR